MLPRWINDKFYRNTEGVATTPTFLGVQLKYIALVVLAAQNATLSIVMHYSRISTPASKAYSAASAVLLNEILKCSISYALVIYNARGSFRDRLRISTKEIFGSDCWKLGIPAILYVIQNNLQYTAISNLSAATFQVAYQMKILTTALFSVILLKKSLSKSKWFALILLSFGVGLVQVQAGKAQSPNSSGSKDGMDPMKGFMAVFAACFTSGLAGVYFEMVLKNNKSPKGSSNGPTDLWTRNVQLSLFSLPPAIIPVLINPSAGAIPQGITMLSFFAPLAPRNLLHNFTPSAYFTVLIQTFGGLLTALVIKHSDNIVKGFATSLAIVLSFLASVLLFGFEMSTGFSVGAAVVLWATALYNRGEPARASLSSSPLPLDDKLPPRHYHAYSSGSEEGWMDEKRFRANAGISTPRSYLDEEKEVSFDGGSQDNFINSSAPSSYASASYSGASSPVATNRSSPTFHQAPILR